MRASYTNEQEALQAKIRQSQIPSLRLSRDLFPNGARAGLHTGKININNAYLIHFNYIMGEDKVKAMKALGLWKVKP
jgi:hypothetical protein